MTVEDLHTEHEPDYYVVTAWNGTGTALVFSSLEAYQRMVDAYEDFRTHYSLPWVHGRAAVNGDHVLEMYDLGLRPWTVSLHPDGHVGSVKSKPLHHITLELVCARYQNGAARTLEVWAESELHARLYALDIMIPTRLAPEDSIKADLDFGWKDPDPDTLKEVLNAEIAQAPNKKEKAKAPPKPTVPGPTIPGFGPTISMADLADA